jgi:hypothetical protein
MKDFYPQAIADAGAEEAWKHAPVIFETCWTMQYWYDKGWDVDYILSEALRWHVTELNNGSEAIPEPWWPKVQEFEKKMGYRLRLAALEHPAKVRAAGQMSIRMDWENEGVAPSYLNYPPAIMFRSEKDGRTWVVETGQDITGWLPGPVNVQSSLNLPADMPSGEYELCVGLLDPNTGKPGIKLANTGLGEDGWYSLSRIVVR